MNSSYTSFRFLLKRYKPTCGSDFVTKEIKLDGKTVILQIWDTVGQERFSSLGSVFYRKTDACILVGDLSNSKSFDSLESWRQVFLEHTSPECAETFPFVCVGNKTDLSSAISRVRFFCKIVVFRRLTNEIQSFISFSFCRIAIRRQGQKFNRGARQKIRYRILKLHARSPQQSTPFLQMPRGKR